MNEEAVILFRQSEKRLNKLKILSNFFDNTDILSIYIKTGVIHDLFKGQDDSDVNKLELFHIQYTDSLIELLDKLKRNNEKNLLVYYTEINSNDSFIEKFKSEGRENLFETDRKYYSSNFSVFLKKVYDDLTDNKIKTNIKDVLYFQENYGSEFYRIEGKSELLEDSNQLKYYECGSLKIERKLLGRLNIANFKMRFICGYILKNKSYELFKMFAGDEYFIFNSSKQKIYLIDKNNVTQLDTSINKSNQTQIVEQLKIKNDFLEEKAKTAKKYIPLDVADVIKTYKESLENISVLSTIFKIDEETNILRAMLNFNLNNNNNGN